MLKFFHKYILHKSVMVVVMSFLMVLFLLPGVDIFTPGPGSEPVGEINGEVVRRSDLQTAEAELRLLSSLVGQAPPADPLTWVLLMHEARQLGIYASTAEVRGALDELQAAGIEPQLVTSRLDAGEDLLIQALRHLLMFDELQQMMVAVRRPSEPRLQHFARDTFSTASADVVIVDAEHVLDQVEEPSEEEIQEHFEQYRDQRPGESEPYGFGYYLPPRVKIEYLAVPLERVAEGVEIEEYDARGYYLDNPQRYMPTEGDDVPEDHPEGEPLPYRAVRDQVYDDLRHERAVRQRDEIISWASGQLTRSEQRLDLQPGGYREIPEDHQLVSLNDLAGRVQERYGVLPDVVRVEDEWLGPEDLRELGDFGMAYLEASGREYGVVSYIRSARELDPPEEHPLLPLALQVGVAGRPVQDDLGNRYIFRLLDADAAREPRELSEVREDVVRDLKRLRAYRELLAKYQDELRLIAMEEGLQGVAETYGTTVRSLDRFQGRTSPRTGAMQPPNLPGVGRSADFVDAVFALAQRAHEEAGSVEEASEELLTTVVGLAHQQALAVTRVREYEPVNRQLYELLRPQMTSQLWQADVQRLGVEANPLRPEAVQQRVGFERYGDREEDLEELGADEVAAGE